MKKMPILVGLSMVIVCSFAFSLAATADEEQKPKIQVALLLDTSNSMDGLIDQAKAQLWEIVNEFIMAKKHGARPELQVALYEYGNDGLPAEEGYIRMVLPFTTDLDKVSEELFALTTNGGKEYCGKIIKVATEELAWSRVSDDLKTIFIAGNEPFTQGDVDYRESCKSVIAQGITVNTIFCGAFEKGISTNWKDGAILADGTYMNIDQNKKAVHIEAPQDKELARLGSELNNTYIPYGSQGRIGSSNQAAQDGNAASIAMSNMAQRALTKASAQYMNASWDLVDALNQGEVKLEELEDKDLSEGMQKMSMEERKAHVEKNAGERVEIQKKINQLNEERKKYVAKKMQELTQSGENTLGAVITKTVRQQGEKKNFIFE